MSPKEMKGFRAVVAAPGRQCRWQFAQNRADPTLTGKRVMLCAGFSGVPISLTEDTQEVVFSHLRSYKTWNDHKEDPRFSQLRSNLGYFHPVPCRGISLTSLALTGRTQAKWVATTDCYNDHDHFFYPLNSIIMTWLDTCFWSPSLRKASPASCLMMWATGGIFLHIHKPHTPLPFVTISINLKTI